MRGFISGLSILSKVKRQPSEWEKIISNEATDKQLISKIYKQLLQLNSGLLFNGYLRKGIDFVAAQVHIHHTLYFR